MSQWPKHNVIRHDSNYGTSTRCWCDCGSWCSKDVPCDCCELAELRAEVERLTADRDKWKARADLPLRERDGLRVEVQRLKDDLAERDRRIEKALRECLVVERPNMLSMTVVGPLMRISAALRGESDA